MATDQTVFTISRVFDAPRLLVYSCCTTADHMRQWFGPKGFELFHSQMDFRIGGIYHYGMRSAGGQTMWARFVFREITPPERIVFVSSFSDELSGLTRAPFFDGKWPLEMETTFSFEELSGNKTNFIVTWKPLGATAEELATFDANRQSMKGGWTGTLDKFTDYLRALEGKP